MSSEPTRGSRRPRPTAPPALAAKNIGLLTGGRELNEQEIINASPVPIPLESAEQAIALFRVMFEPTDLVNIVARYAASMEENGKVVVRPKTPGWTGTTLQWCSFFRHNCVPECHAGCWYRINPVRAHRGSGAGGSHGDCDVRGYDKVLVEFDEIPIGVQLAFFAFSPLPILALVHSGGKSAHAILRLDCQYRMDRERFVDPLYDRLRHFGADMHNKNASRFSRLPGAVRRQGGRMRRQSLLYLDPEARPEPIIQL